MVVVESLPPCAGRERTAPPESAVSATETLGADLQRSFCTITAGVWAFVNSAFFAAIHGV